MKANEQSNCKVEATKDSIANTNQALKPNQTLLGTSRVQGQRKGQVIVQIANTLGLNCKKLKHNWATVQQRETWGIKRQNSEKIFMQHMQLTKEICFCNFPATILSAIFHLAQVHLYKTKQWIQRLNLNATT